MKSKDKITNSYRTKANSGLNGKDEVGNKVNGDVPSAIDKFAFTDDDEEMDSEKERRDRRRQTHNIAEKRRKERISISILKLQDVLPHEYVPTKKQTLHEVVEKAIVCVEDMKEKLDRCLLGHTENVKGEEMGRLREQIRSLTEKNNLYEAVLKNSDIPEELHQNPDMVLKWRASKKKEQLPTVAMDTSVAEVPASPDRASQNGEATQPESNRRRGLTLGEHLRRQESTRPEVDVAVPSVGIDTNNVVASTCSEMPPPSAGITSSGGMLVPGSIGPPGGSSSSQLQVDTFPNLLLSPNMSAFLSPSTASSDASKASVTTMEPELLSGVSGLLSLSKATPAAPGDANIPSKDDNDKSNVTVSELTPAANTSSDVPVCEVQTSITLPSVPATQSGVATVTTSSVTMPPNMSTNQVTGMPMLPNPLTSGSLILQNGQLILVPGDPNTPGLPGTSQQATTDSSQVTTPAAPSTGIMGNNNSVLAANSMLNNPVLPASGMLGNQMPMLGTNMLGGMLTNPGLMNNGLLNNTVSSSTTANSQLMQTPPVFMPPGLMLNNGQMLMPPPQPMMMGQDVLLGNQSMVPGQPGNMISMNTVPSQPNQLPSALVLPNGQIVPVVSQPNMMSLGGGLLMPTGPPTTTPNPALPVLNLPRFTTPAHTTLASASQPQTTTGGANVPLLTGVDGKTIRPIMPLQPDALNLKPPVVPTQPARPPLVVSSGDRNSPAALTPSMPLISTSAPSMNKVINTAHGSGAPPTTVPNIPSNATVIMAADGTILFTLPPGANPGNLVLDPNNMPVPPTPLGLPAGQSLSKKPVKPGQRILMPKPTGASFPAFGDSSAGFVMSPLDPQLAKFTTVETKNSRSSNKRTSASATRANTPTISSSAAISVAPPSESGTSKSGPADLLAQATESIFAGSDFYNPANEDNPLQIDTSVAEGEEADKKKDGSAGPVSELPKLEMKVNEEISKAEPLVLSSSSELPPGSGLTVSSVSLPSSVMVSSQALVQSTPALPTPVISTLPVTSLPQPTSLVHTPSSLPLPIMSTGLLSTMPGTHPPAASGPVPAPSMLSMPLMDGGGEATVRVDAGPPMLSMPSLGPSGPLLPGNPVPQLQPPQIPSTTAAVTSCLPAITATPSVIAPQRLAMTSPMVVTTQPPAAIFSTSIAAPLTTTAPGVTQIQTPDSTSEKKHHKKKKKSRSRSRSHKHGDKHGEGDEKTDENKDEDKKEKKKRKKKSKKSKSKDPPEAPAVGTETILPERIQLESDLSAVLHQVEKINRSTAKSLAVNTSVNTAIVNTSVTKSIVSPPRDKTLVDTSVDKPGKTLMDTSEKKTHGDTLLNKSVDYSAKKVTVDTSPKKDSTEPSKPSDVSPGKKNGRLMESPAEGVPPSKKSKKASDLLSSQLPGLSPLGIEIEEDTIKIAMPEVKASALNESILSFMQSDSKEANLSSPTSLSPLTVIPWSKTKEDTVIRSSDPMDLVTPRKDHSQNRKGKKGSLDPETAPDVGFDLLRKSDELDLYSPARLGFGPSITSSPVRLGLSQPSMTSSPIRPRLTSSAMTSQPARLNFEPTSSTASPQKTTSGTGASNESTLTIDTTATSTQVQDKADASASSQSTTPLTSAAIPQANYAPLTQPSPSLAQNSMHTKHSKPTPTLTPSLHSSSASQKPTSDLPVYSTSFSRPNDVSLEGSTASQANRTIVDSLDILSSVSRQSVPSLPTEDSSKKPSKDSRQLDSVAADAAKPSLSQSGIKASSSELNHARHSNIAHLAHLTTPSKHGSPIPSKAAAFKQHMLAASSGSPARTSSPLTVANKNSNTPTPREAMNMQDKPKTEVIQKPEIDDYTPLPITKTTASANTLSSSLQAKVTSQSGTSGILAPSDVSSGGVSAAPTSVSYHISSKPSCMSQPATTMGSLTPGGSSIDEGYITSPGSINSMPGSQSPYSISYKPDGTMPGVPPTKLSPNNQSHKVGSHTINVPTYKPDTTMSTFKPDGNVSSYKPDGAMATASSNLFGPSKSGFKGDATPMGPSKPPCTQSSPVTYSVSGGVSKPSPSHQSHNYTPDVATGSSGSSLHTSWSQPGPLSTLSPNHTSPRAKTQGVVGKDMAAPTGQSPQKDMSNFTQRSGGTTSQSGLSMPQTSPQQTLPSANQQRPPVPALSSCALQEKAAPPRTTVATSTIPVSTVSTSPSTSVRTTTSSATVVSSSTVPAASMAPPLSSTKPGEACSFSGPRPDPSTIPPSRMATSASKTSSDAPPAKKRSRSKPKTSPEGGRGSKAKSRAAHGMPSSCSLGDMHSQHFPLTNHFYGQQPPPCPSSPPGARFLSSFGLPQSSSPGFSFTLSSTSGTAAAAGNAHVANPSAASVYSATHPQQFFSYTGLPHGGRPQYRPQPHTQPPGLGLGHPFNLPPHAHNQLSPRGPQPQSSRGNPKQSPQMGNTGANNMPGHTDNTNRSPRTPLTTGFLGGDVGSQGAYGDTGLSMDDRNKCTRPLSHSPMLPPTSQPSRHVPSPRAPHLTSNMPPFYPGMPFSGGHDSSSHTGLQMLSPRFPPHSTTTSNQQQRRPFDSTQLTPHFSASGYEPPSIQFSQASDLPSQMTPSFQQGQAKPAAPPADNVRPKSVTTGKAASSKSQRSSKNSKKKPNYPDVDTNLGNSIFDSNGGRSMTPMFQPVTGMSPPPSQRASVQPDAPTYLPFGQPGRPLSNTTPLQHKSDMGTPFNPLFSGSRAQNGLGLQFQPGFGMSTPGHSQVPSSQQAHSGSMANFNFSGLFPDMGGAGQNEALNMSPIKLGAGGTLLPPQAVMDHASISHPGAQGGSMYPQRTHMLHNAMSINNLLHPGFEGRPMAPSLNGAMGSPFPPHAHASFGMPPPLNFQLHDH